MSITGVICNSIQVSASELCLIYPTSIQLRWNNVQSVQTSIYVYCPQAVIYLQKGKRFKKKTLFSTNSVIIMGQPRHYCQVRPSNAEYKAYHVKHTIGIVCSSDTSCMIILPNSIEQLRAPLEKSRDRIQSLTNYSHPGNLALDTWLLLGITSLHTQSCRVQNITGPRIFRNAAPLLSSLVTSPLPYRAAPLVLH